MKADSVNLKFNTVKTALTFKENKPKEHYLNAEGAIPTEDKVHPLKPKGHLIHDSFANSVKYFFKDRAYDLKAVKDGIKGTANDHQSGRLNDVGIVTSGVLIATYLASKTPSLKARIMEYVGLGAFLTAMSVYPKAIINTPAKLMHGYDFDKEYIDDQGRKKSVMQDSNYVPYDMYRAEVPEEDISLIGDKLGIPKDIKNRNDVIKEQMRKIATQNNTLWTLTAGITPAIGALLCCGLEKYVVSPSIEKAGLKLYRDQVAGLLDKTKNMTTEITSIKPNKLSKKVEDLLVEYKGQELPKRELDNLIQVFSDDVFVNTNQGIKEDIVKILGSSAKGDSVLVSDKIILDMLSSAKSVVSKSNKEIIEKNIIPTQAELENILKQVLANEEGFAKPVSTSIDNVAKIKEALKNLMDTKIAKTEGVSKEFLISQRNDILENISKTIKSNKSFQLSEESFNKIVDFAKVLGEFQENQKALQNCARFNMEHVEQSIIARSYSKFETALLDGLGIKFKDLKKMRESSTYTKEILDKKFSEIVKDEQRFSKLMEKLGKTISDLEVKLHGESVDKSNLLDLINSIENNYNNTARRLSKLGAFETTINRMVKQDTQSLGNNLMSRKELFDYLDGVVQNKFHDLEPSKWYDLSHDMKLKYIKANSSGVGSSKNLEISKILERYQGVKNSYNRILHTLDVYKRSLKPEEFAEVLKGKDSQYVESILKKGKKTLLEATSTDHILKLQTVNTPNFYKDLMASVWAGQAGEANSVAQKGLLSDATKNSLNKFNSMESGNVLERFQTYITRFRNLVSNNTIDFTKPHHVLDSQVARQYTQAEKTRVSFFNLVGQNPVDMAKGAAGRRYATQKWLRIIGAITASVFGVALLSQFCFGKLSNPQNLKKQVDYDANK